MEHVVYAHVGREIKGASGRRGSLDDLERSKESRFELGRGVDVLKMDVLGGETNHVANGVGNIATCLVGVVALTLLCFGDGVMCCNEGVLNELESRGSMRV